MADAFLAKNNPEGKPPMLFHPHGRGFNGALAGRACPDAPFRALFNRLKDDYFLYNAERISSEHDYPFSQRELPVFHSNGWAGLDIIRGLLERSVGVVLQGSCSLFSIAQAARKPILCANGACGPRIRHLSSPTMPADQRQVAEMEGEPYCNCFKDCGAIKTVSYDVDRALSDFFKFLKPLSVK